MDSEEETRLILAAQAGDRDAMERLIELCAPLITKLIRDRFHAPNDDARQECVLAVIGAVRLFDSGRGFRFRTYAAHRIRGAMLDWLREQLPVGARRPANRRFLRKSVSIDALPLDCRGGDWEQDELSTEQLLAVDDDDYFELLLSYFLRPHHRAVLDLTVRTGLDQKQIARRLSICDSRVSQVWRQILRRVRWLVESGRWSSVPANSRELRIARSTGQPERHGLPAPAAAPAATAAFSKEDSMLVLGRKTGETIELSSGVTITVVRCGDGRARIGIEAPRDVQITRPDAKVKVAMAAQPKAA